MKLKFAFSMIKKTIIQNEVAGNQAWKTFFTWAVCFFIIITDHVIFSRKFVLAT